MHECRVGSDPQMIAVELKRIGDGAAKTIVAVANKNARVIFIFAMLKAGTECRAA